LTWHKPERREAAIAQGFRDGECEHAAAIQDPLQTASRAVQKQQPGVVDIEITVV
jgi:hypothetical protein